MLDGLPRGLRRVAHRKSLAILLAGLAPLLLRLVLLPWLPAPQPRVHDEFSHLLVADTLVQGRLVNPVHPMWVHFESIHILVQPVYASIFPVAQGAFLAVGKFLTGHPWSGVWLSVACMCAALCWMLQQWVSPGWALFGGLMAGLRFGVLSYWMNSYFGGAVAATAGALVLGALPGVIRRRGDWRYAAVMAVGIAMLATSRPYEGMLFSVPIALILMWTLWKRKRRVRFLVTLALIPAATVVGMAYYNSRFTGNPLQLPYAFYRQNFTMAPHFIFQQPRPQPVFHNRVLRRYHMGWEMECYNAAHENRPPYRLIDKAKVYWRFFLGPVLTIPLLCLTWLWRRRRIQIMLLAVVWFCAGLSIEVWRSPHYAAPALGVVVLLVILGMQTLQRRTPVALSGVLCACLCIPIINGSGVASLGAWQIFVSGRSEILRKLETGGGRHLVLVRYRLDHDPGDEWVYNSANIDSAPVVWARELDSRSNAKLQGYLHDRKVWLVQPDAPSISLIPYEQAPAPDSLPAFVSLGDGAIDALRSPEEIKRKILDDPRSRSTELSCDQWNYLFTAVTGFEAPDGSRGCFTPEGRGRSVSFDVWFNWLRQQR